MSMTPDVPAQLEFDATRLEAYLRAHIPDLSGQMRLQRIGGGQSNPTFFVDFDYRCLVLRKKPAGVLLPSAHAVDREYRVMKALAGTDVPVPKMVLFEPEPDIVGTPFYLMDKLEGRVFAEYSIPGVTPEHRHAMYLSMADTMARLHAVDWNNIGLGDYGKPGNYFNRQVVRWTRTMEGVKNTREPLAGYVDCVVAGAYTGRRRNHNLPRRPAFGQSDVPPDRTARDRLARLGVVPRWVIRSPMSPSIAWPGTPCRVNTAASTVSTTLRSASRRKPNTLPTITVRAAVAALLITR